MFFNKWLSKEEEKKPQKEENPKPIKVSIFNFKILFLDGSERVIEGTNCEWGLDFLEVFHKNRVSDGNLFMTQSSLVKSVETEFLKTVDILK